MARRYDIDTEAVTAARKELGVRLPVRIFFCRYANLGARYIRQRHGVHHIGLASDLSAAVASRMLWHELTHAQQAERLGSERAFWERWWSERGAAGVSLREARRAEGRAYRNTPLEAEAHANERRHRQLALARRSIDSTTPTRPSAFRALVRMLSQRG